MKDLEQRSRTCPGVAVRTKPEPKTLATRLCSPSYAVAQKNTQKSQKIINLDS